MSTEPTTQPTTRPTPKPTTQPPGKPPCLYRELADWYPLLTPVADYAEEAASYHRLFETHCRHPPRTLLDLGSGGGHNAAHLQARLSCTLVDLAPAMLAQSRRLNPKCEHVQADMRSVKAFATAPNPAGGGPGQPRRPP